MAATGPVQGPLGDEHTGARGSGDQFIGHLQLAIACHYDPVLAAVLVSLQAEPLAAANQEPFHQIVLAAGQGFIPTPGALDPSSWARDFSCAHPLTLAGRGGYLKGVVTGVIRVACCLALVRAV